MNHQLIGEYGRVMLTPLSLEESERMRVLRNHNRQWFFYSGEITLENQIKWYQNYLTKPDEMMFSIYHKESEKWIGAVALYNIDTVNHEAEFGRLVVDGANVHERGLGLDATICICRIGFEQLKLSKIKLEVYRNNIAAQKTYEKAGFSVKENKLDKADRNIILMELNNKERE